VGPVDVEDQVLFIVDDVPRLTVDGGAGPP